MMGEIHSKLAALEKYQAQLIAPLKVENVHLKEFDVEHFEQYLCSETFQVALEVNLQDYAPFIPDLR